MSKRLIIIENCMDCPSATLGFLIGHQHVCARMFPDECVCPEVGTPEWCPLPEMLERQDEFDIQEYVNKCEADLERRMDGWHFVGDKLPEPHHFVEVYLYGHGYAAHGIANLESDGWKLYGIAEEPQTLTEEDICFWRYFRLPRIFEQMLKPGKEE